MVTTEQLEAVLWLGVPGVGSQTLAKIDYFLRRQRLSWHQSWQLISRLTEQRVLTKLQSEQATQYCRTKWSTQIVRAKLAEAAITVVGRASKHYPKLLQQISTPPFLFFCYGNKDLLLDLNIRPSIAVVGTRKITPYGALVTKSLVEQLVNERAVIISGGMYGVDAAAHAAALSNQGKTIAVLASGLAKTGSYWQQALCQQIIEGQGLLISEFFPWQSSQKSHFPIRNRVVAGLAQAVVVTEAAQKSGSLITAQFALDNGREVCAVPGPITSEFSLGTKWLLNQGATLVTSGRDVLMACEYFWEDKTTPEIKIELNGPEKPEKMVCHYLQTAGSGTTTQLAEQLNLPVAQLLPILSKLELIGRICNAANSWYLAS